MAGEFLNRPRSRTLHRQVRAERVPEDMDANVAKIGLTSRPRNETLNQPLGQRTPIG